ncbi:hypothetical protein RYH80_15045 [Halobaculum sp. MBLA0147]|uniref:hypothetical protein n=1 Tax=Halobaculum sp. MBLA0147 TaxID=3079934 RepID=UPI0035253EE4
MTTPLTNVWQSLRAETADRAATLRADGRTVVRALADHTAVAPDRRAVQFTVGSETAERVTTVADPGTTERSTVAVADADGVRFLHVEIVTESGVLLLAGGVDHDDLLAMDPGPVETVVATLNERAAVFDHERLAPFVAGLA